MGYKRDLLFGKSFSITTFLWNYVLLFRFINLAMLELNICGDSLGFVWDYRENLDIGNVKSECIGHPISW